MLTTPNVPKKIKIRNTMREIIGLISQWHSSIPPGKNAMCSPTSTLILDRLTWHRLTFCQTYQKHSQFAQYHHMFVPVGVCGGELSFHSNMFHLVRLHT